MDAKTKENIIVSVTLVVSSIIIIGVIVGIIYLARSFTKTKDKTQENFNPPPVSNANLLYTDANGNLGATSDVGITYLTVSNGTKLSGGCAVDTLNAGTLDAGSVKQAGKVLVPSGVIVMWSGTTSNIPDGWVLCDGNNSTPNLSGRFIVGVGSNGTTSYSAKDRGGADSITLSSDQLPSHTHAVTDPGHSHTYGYLNPIGGSGFYGGSYWGPGNSSGTSESSKTGITLGSTGGGKSFDNRPIYFALCYIMKT